MGLAFERLSFRDRDLTLHSQHLLEPYLRNLPERPDFRLRTIGYSAAWEIRDDDTLRLTSLKTRPDNDGPDPGLRLLFPTAAPVAATWVNQTLRCSDPAQKRFSPIGIGTTYPRETHLSIWKGLLIAVEETDVQSNRRVGGELSPHLERLFGPEEGAFLRAAFAAPDDAAPRLIYADWLEERDDPRAELVRLADRLRTLDPEAASRERMAYRDRLAEFRSPAASLWLRLLGHGELMDLGVLVANG